MVFEVDGRKEGQQLALSRLAGSGTRLRRSQPNQSGSLLLDVPCSLPMVSGVFPGLVQGA